MVDDRFAKIQRYTNQLSKWARNSILHYNTFQPMIESLKLFTDKFIAIDAAEHRASQAVADTKLLESSDDSDCSPVKMIEPVKKESPGIEVIDVDDDPRPYKRSVASREEPVPKMETPTRRKQFATLITGAKKLSAAQRKLAAEHGSRFFSNEP